MHYINIKFRNLNLNIWFGLNVDFSPKTY